MSYDLYLLPPGVDRPREASPFDDEEPTPVPAPASPAGQRRSRLRAAIASALVDWAPDRAEGEDAGSGEAYAWHHRASGLQCELFDDEGAVALPLGPGDIGLRMKALEDLLAVVRAHSDFELYDGPADQRVPWPDGQEALHQRYRRACEQVARAQVSSPPRHQAKGRELFPPRLGRQAYLGRWLILAGSGGLLFVAVLALVLGTPYEPLVLLPAAAATIIKLFWLDPARLRDLGWSPFLTLLNLVPPINLVFQLLLFLLESQLRRGSAAITARSGK